MKIITPAKFAVQQALQKRGWELKRFEEAETTRLARYLSIHRIDTVIDVGANIGQFAATLRLAGYTGRIVSFEPQTDAHARLTSAANGDPLWTVAPRTAVGANPGEIELNISDNSVSSSALPILDQHTSAASSSRYVGSERVSVIRLDDSADVPASGEVFLKIDTQGFEQHVLDGSPELLKRARGLQFEMSLTPLYEGQANFVDLIRQVQALGFDVWSINPGFTDGSTGRLLQADATFFRR